MRNVRIPETQHRNATLDQPARPRFIRLDVSWVSMLTTVDLNHKTDRRRIEVENEDADRMLSSKIHVELPTAKLLPKLHFDVGGDTA